MLPDCCPWDENNGALFAAYPGHLKILRWAREHGCEWDEQTCAEPPRADIRR